MDMMNFKGQTVEEAVKAAAEFFGVATDAIEYNVLKQPKDGFLGIFGGKSAEIEASVKELPEEEPAEMAAVEEAAAEVEEVIEESVEPETTVEEAIEAAEEAIEEAEAEENEIDEPEEEPAEAAEPELGVFGVFASAKEACKALPNRIEEEDSTCAVEPCFAKAPIAYEEEEETEEEASKPRERRAEYGVVISDDEALERVQKFLEGLLANMGVEGTVATSITGDRIEAAISGEHVGAVIGHRGETLDCIQYLTGLVVNRQNDSFRHVNVDAEGYRAKREATVRSLAKRCAQKCIKSHRAVVLDPMNANERRIIHMELQNYRQVSTHSEGEEPYRKVVITFNRGERE